MKRKVLLFAVAMLIGLMFTTIALGQSIGLEPVARLGKGRIEQVLFSPDGKTLAIAGSLGVWLYDAKNLSEIGLLECPGWTYSISFSPDGKILASYGWGEFNGWTGEIVVLWDIEKQKEIATLPGFAYPQFRSDGKMLSLDGGDVYLHDVAEQPKVVAIFEKWKGMGKLFFSPDGKLIVSDDRSGTVRLWDVTSQKEIAVFEGSADILAFSPDSRWIALSSGKWYVAGGYTRDIGANIWNIAKQQKVKMPFGFIPLAFSSDSKSLAAVGEDQVVSVLDITTQKEVAVLGEHPILNCTTFSPDGKWLVVSSRSTVYLWDVTRQEEGARLKHMDSVVDIAFSSNSKWLTASGLDGIIKFWDVASQKEVPKSWEDNYVAVKASMRRGSNRELLLTAPGRLWNSEHIIEIEFAPDDIYSFDFSPDGKWLALGGEDGTIHLWDMAFLKNALEEFPKEFAFLAGRKEGKDVTLIWVVFNPNSDHLAFHRQFGLYPRYIWDMTFRRPVGVLKGHTKWVKHLLFSPDSRLLASESWNRSVRLWDVGLQREITVLRSTSGSSDWSKHIAFSPDGALFAYGRVIYRVSEAECKRAVGLESGHDTTCVAFSSDGKWFAAGSSNGTICLWDTRLITSEQSAKPIKAEAIKSDKEGRAVQAQGKLPTTWGRIKETELFQNYPNPFNPETWIPYQLAEDAEVIIKIFSSTGSLIRTLELGRQSAGAYLSKDKAAYWDGRDNLGEPVASGVYFYTFKANEFTATKKMIIAR